MKIRTKLHTNGLITLVTALVIGLLLNSFSWQAEMIRDERAEVLIVLGQARELRSLGFEYVLNREARILDQWQHLHGAMGTILNKIRAKGAEELRIFQTIKQDRAAAKALIGKLETLSKTPVTQRNKYGETILINQLLLKTQDLVSRAFELESTYDARVVKADKTQNMWIIIFISGLALVTLGINWFFAHSIGGPLALLTAGANALGEGHLDHRINLKREDELGELAAAFDSMADQILMAYAELEHRVQQRTSELTAANKELEAFAYTVSHDLRAPLRAMDGFARIVMDDYAPRLGDEGRRQLGIIRDNAQRMSRLIDDLLNFSLMGRHEIALSEIDMTALATGVAEELRLQEPHRKIKIDIGHLPRIPGDTSMMRQVWVNLIANAIKFTRPQPEAHIEISSLTEAGENIYIVKDNGVGFDMQYADKLFGVFHRLHGQEEFEGTGIGLAIVKRIIDRHGGRIWAESAVNGGATFFFALPK